jgi:nucleoside permease NupC
VYLGVTINAGYNIRIIVAIYAKADTAFSRSLVPVYQAITSTATITELWVTRPVFQRRTIWLKLVVALLTVDTLTTYPQSRWGSGNRRVQQVQRESTIAHFAEKGLQFILGSLARDLANLAVRTTPTSHR